MSNEGGDKTEEPTDKKIRDAREKGQVAKSKEIVSTALMIFLFGFLFLMSDFYIDKIKEIILLPGQYIHLPFMDALSEIVEPLIMNLIYLTIPFGVLALLIGIISHLVQFGFLISGESIKPEFKKINPVEGFKRIFAIKSLVEFFKSIIKVVLLTVLIVIVLKDNMNELLYIPLCGLHCVLPVVGNIFKQLIYIAAIGFIIISAADFLFEKHQHRKQLKMTKDEVKREFKEMEGSPEIKGKRKQFHQELMSSNGAANVKRSSVLVTNPTHLAIGILYDKEETPLPLITFKSADKEAKRLIEYAKDLGIPVIQKIPLARALYEHGEIEQYIPGDLIKPVAEVLKWVATIEKENDNDN